MCSRTRPSRFRIVRRENAICGEQIFKRAIESMRYLGVYVMREPFAVFLRLGAPEQELEQAVGVLADGQRLADRVPLVVEVCVLELALVGQGLFDAFHRAPGPLVFPGPPPPLGG